MFKALIHPVSGGKIRNVNYTFWREISKSTENSTVYNVVTGDKLYVSIHYRV